MSDAERSAHRVHKVNYDVGLEVPPYRVVGSISLYPGNEPDRLLDRSPEMFIPVVQATVTMGELAIGEPNRGVVLVNRAYLRGVQQVDPGTGERPLATPGCSVGRGELDRSQSLTRRGARPRGLRRRLGRARPRA